MRVLDRLAAVVVALAFALVGLGTPVRGETLEPGAVVIAAYRSIVHDGPSAHPPAGRPVIPVTTSDRPAPPSGDPRAVVARLTPLDAPPQSRAEFSGVPRGDHRAGVVTDGPDDLLPATPVRVVGTPHSVVAPTRYRQPAVPLPPRGTLPSRAPPALA